MYVCNSVEQVTDPCSQGLEKSYTVNNSILVGIQPHLKHFHHLLLNPLKVGLLLWFYQVLKQIQMTERCHMLMFLDCLHSEMCDVDHDGRS